MTNDTRKLAAVMFTDMVGYTALMQENEQKARTDRDRHRQVMERLIREHDGVIEQYFGDGTMCTFGSAVQAVQCALEIQLQLRQEPKIPVRIGLHVGDIVYEEDGIFGDAVNVASRIESISVPGGVLFSGKVFDDLKNHPQFSSVPIGEFKFKNVKRPIRVYALNHPLLKLPDAKDLKGKGAPAIKSVAVLPFVNMSADPDNEYFSDGMSEELINAFTKVEGLEVTARTSSFAFKGKNMDIREIGAQLGVDTVLEGSVRKAGNRVRVTAQLINISDGYHLFSENYDRGLEDIFAVQDEISQEITRKLAGHIDGARLDVSLVKSLTSNIEAYNLYLKGLFFWRKFSTRNIKKSLEYFREAVALDPGFAAAYSMVANCHTVMGAMGSLHPSLAYPPAEEYAQKALELDDDLNGSHLAMAMVKMFYRWDFDGAHRAIQRALKLSPGSGGAHHIHSMYLKAVGKPAEAIEASEHAVRLDPLSTSINNHLAMCYTAAGRYDDAIRQLDKILEIEPAFRSAVNMKGWNLYLNGETALALEVLEKDLDITNPKHVNLTIPAYIYAKSGREADARACLDKMKRRLETDPTVDLDMGFVFIYTALGELDTAFVHLQKALDERLGGVIFTRDNPSLEELRADPRYKTMMEKAGLGAVA